MSFLTIRFVLSPVSHLTLSVAVRHFRASRTLLRRIVGPTARACHNNSSNNNRLINCWFLLFNNNSRSFLQIQLSLIQLLALVLVLTRPVLFLTRFAAVSSRSTARTQKDFLQMLPDLSMKAVRFEIYEKELSTYLVAIGTQSRITEDSGVWLFFLSSLFNFFRSTP